MKKQKILIVKKDSNDLFRLINILSSEEYKIHVALNEIDAFHLSLFEKPDLILLELETTKINGFHLLDDLMKMKSKKKIPILMIIDNPDELVSEHLKKLGVKDFIASPIEKEILIKKIQSVLSKKTFSLFR